MITRSLFFQEFTIQEDTIPLKIMIKMRLYVSIGVFLILMFQSCDECEDGHTAILIVNKSNGDIWFGESGTQHNGLDCQHILSKIDADTTYSNDLLRVCWEDRINKTYQGKVVFYFFEENYFSTHPSCDSIEFNQSVKERREYTVADLNALNWVIEYP
jgi:hypothetical protein